MVEEDRQEGYFWETDSWVMSGKSSGGPGKDDNEERSPDDKNLNEPSVDNNASEMKLQLNMGDTSGSSDGSKRNNDTTFDAKNDEDDMKVISRDSNKGKGEVELSEHELHIWTERERRKKMRSMFQQLHALIPQLPPKTDKSTIVDEAVSYIKTLQQTIQRLERKKLERFYGATSKTVIASPIKQPKMTFDTRESFLADQGSSTTHIGEISPSNSTSFPFPIRSPTVFETWASSNVTLNVCGQDAHFSILCSPKPGLLTAICFVLEKHNLEIVSAQISSDQLKSLFMIHAHANSTHDRFAETSSYDEIYKKAATEIMHWINSN